MLDMGSKITYAILNDKLKIKCCFTPKPQFRVRKLFFQNVFSSIKLQTSSPIPFPIIFPPTSGDFRVLRIASNVIQVNTEREKKSWHFLLGKKPS